MLCINNSCYLNVWHSVNTENALLLSKVFIDKVDFISITEFENLIKSDSNDSRNKFLLLLEN